MGGGWPTTSVVDCGEIRTRENNKTSQNYKSKAGGTEMVDVRDTGANPDALRTHEHKPTRDGVREQRREFKQMPFLFGSIGTTEGGDVGL